MSRCYKCGLENLSLVFSETTQKAELRTGAGQKHSCQSQPIPLYTEINSIMVRRSEQGIAASIVEEAIKNGWNPYRVRTERKDDFIIVKP